MDDFEFLGWMDEREYEFYNKRYETQYLFRIAEPCYDYFDILFPHKAWDLEDYLQDTGVYIDEKHKIELIDSDGMVEDGVLFICSACWDYIEKMSKQKRYYKHHKYGEPCGTFTLYPKKHRQYFDYLIKQN